ncbi:PQQ-binding-like beta-propeller repeat protein [Catellatospora sp. NPDC049609]|uniref:outer membrane protein assembly factor BamB family protein n=1 Tax=Catellatospora sp. NPDC049609 TaxID=3155505 RepID=UPI0034465595
MTVLIDLGDPRGLDDEPAAPPLSPARRRGVLLAAVALAGLLGFGGSATVPPLPLTQVAHFDPPLAAPVVTTGDLVLALDRRESGRALAAIGGADGAQRWRVPLTGATTEVYEAVRAGGTLLVTVFDSAAQTDMWSTYALDPDTGALRWQARAMVLGVAPRAADWTVLLAVGTEPERFSGRDAATGRELWHLSPPGPRSWSRYRVGGVLGGLVLFEVAERMTARLLSPDGTLGEPRPIPDGLEGVQVAGDLAVTAYVADGARRVAALRLPGLAPAWDVAYPVGGNPLFVDACAPMICVNGSDWISVLDPADGGTRWEGQVGGAYPLASGLLVSNVNERPRHGVLRDTATGGILLRLAQWTVIGHDGRAVLLAYIGDDRTWFGAVDLDRPGRLRVIGVGGPTLDRCWLGDGTVVCEAMLGGLDVYRYRL